MKKINTINKSFNLLILYSVALLSLILIIIFAFSTEMFQYGDNCGYMSLGISFADGKGFINPALPGKHDFLWWPPGFPLFLALYYKIAGASWHTLKYIQLISLFVAFVLFVNLILNKEKNLLKSVILLLFLCFNSPIHMLSSYLYAETFFCVCVLCFFVFWNSVHEKLSLFTIITLSIFAVYISSVRLLGISLPIALILYLLLYNKKRELKWMSLIPLSLTIAFVLISLFKPGWQIGSLQSEIGMRLKFSSPIVSTGNVSDVGGLSIFNTFFAKIILFLRGYGLTLIPQSLIRFYYDLFTMNKTKAFLMGIISLFTLLGYVKCLKSYVLINIFTFLYMGILLIYGPLYVRLLVPIIPFLVLFLYTGIDAVFKMFIEGPKINRTIMISIFTIIIGGNIFLTFTDTHRSMPSEFGDDNYQECINWIILNAKQNNTIVCQNNSYLYLRRGAYCLPFIGAKTPNELMAYLDEYNVKYIIVSPFYHRQHETYMNTTYQAIEIYPQNFKIVYGIKENKSYVLEFFSNGKL